MAYYKELPEYILKDTRQMTLVVGNDQEAFKKILDLSCEEIDKRKRREVEKEVRHGVHFINTAEKRKKNKDYTKAKGLTAKERKKLDLFKLDPAEQKYELFQPLHELWQDYIRDLVDFSKINKANKSQAMMKLIRADYHGALISVAKSKCPSLVGFKGIIVQETKNTFKIITTKDELKTIPKENSVFSFEIDGFKGTIYGRQFMLKASERIHRKFKTKHTIDL